jgi:hypothetical protein
MTSTDQDLARDQAESTRRLLEEVWEAIDNDTQIEDQDGYEYLEAMPLEIVWEVGEEFAVVLGTGGPHTEITGGGRGGGYELHCYWGGHTVLRGTAITRTGGHFREQMQDQG